MAGPKLGPYEDSAAFLICRIGNLDWTRSRLADIPCSMQWRNPSPSLDHDACGTGFVLRLGAPPSREVIDRALVALQRLAHRGAVDAAGTSGDGAGLMTSLPEEFFRCRALE